jgi:hypothetical protein
MIKGLFTKPKLVKEGSDSNKTSEQSSSGTVVEESDVSGDRTANLTKLVEIFVCCVDF